MSDQRPAIAVVGSINMDLVTYCDAAPRAGETVSGTDFRTAHGGKGANQAVAAARMGGAVRMVGCVGTDGFGREMLAGLAAAGVDTAGVRQVPGPSGVATILVEASGQNRIVVVPGANGALTGLTESDRSRVAGCQFLLLQLESPLPAVIAAAQAARAAGTAVMLTPAPARPLPDELLSCVNWLIPNEPELEVLTGMSAGTLAQVEQAARSLHNRVANVVVTLGSRGCLYVPRAGEALHVPAVPVKPVDTTAAGDTFTGALAVALGEGVATPAALAFANRAAALSVTRHGAQPSMPTRAEVDAYGS